MSRMSNAWNSLIGVAVALLLVLFVSGPANGAEGRSDRASAALADEEPLLKPA